MLMIHSISSLFGSKVVDPLNEIIDADCSSNFSTPSFCRSVASGCRTPDVDDEGDVDGNEENCVNDDDDSPKSAEAILISPINRPHLKDFDESNSVWKLDESMDFKNLVIANLSPFRTKKLKAVSVSLFENNADVFSEKQMANGIDKQKSIFGSTEDIDLHEVYAEAKYINKVDEVEETSKLKSTVFRFDEFFVAISGYVFLLFAVFTALFVYRMQSSAWATGGDGGVRLGGFCSSCAMEQLQKSFYYPISSTLTNPSPLSTSSFSNLQDQPLGASTQSKTRNKSLRDSSTSRNEFTSSTSFGAELTSLSTIKILWMNIFFVLKDTNQPTTLFQNSAGAAYTSIRGGKPTTGIRDDLKQREKSVDSSISGPVSNDGEKHRHPTTSEDHIPTVPVSIDLPKAKNEANQVIKISKAKSQKENASRLSNLPEKKKEKPTTGLSTTATSPVTRSGSGQALGLKRVLNGIKGVGHRVVQGVKKFFHKNAKYTNILLAVGVYLILIV